MAGWRGETVRIHIGRPCFSPFAFSLVCESDLANSSTTGKTPSGGRLAGDYSFYSQLPLYSDLCQIIAKFVVNAFIYYI